MIRTLIAVTSLALAVVLSTAPALAQPKGEGGSLTAPPDSTVEGEGPRSEECGGSGDGRGGSGGGLDPSSGGPEGGLPPGPPTCPPPPIGLPATGDTCPDGSPAGSEPCLFVFFHGTGGENNSSSFPNSQQTQQVMHQLIGIPPGGDESEALATAVRAAGCDVYYARWDGSTSWIKDADELGTIAGDVREQIELRDAEAGQEIRVLLHGHSGGGLILAHILNNTIDDDDTPAYHENNAFLADRAERVTAIASPYGGSTVADLVMNVVDPNATPPTPAGGHPIDDTLMHGFLADLLIAGRLPSLHDSLTTNKALEYLPNHDARTTPIGLIVTGAWNVPSPLGPGAHPVDYRSFFFGSLMGYAGEPHLLDILDAPHVIAGLAEALIPDPEGDGVLVQELWAMLGAPGSPLWIQGPPRGIHLATSALPQNVVDDLHDMIKKKVHRAGKLLGIQIVTWNKASDFADHVLERFDFELSLGDCAGSGPLDGHFIDECLDILFDEGDDIIQFDLKLAMLDACDATWPSVAQTFSRNKCRNAVVPALQNLLGGNTLKGALKKWAPRTIAGVTKGLSCNDGIVTCASSAGEMVYEPGTFIGGSSYPMGYVPVNHIRAMYDIPTSVHPFDANGTLGDPVDISLGDWLVNSVVCSQTPIPPGAQNGGAVHADLGPLRGHCSMDQCIADFCGPEPWCQEPDPDCQGDYLDWIDCMQTEGEAIEDCDEDNTCLDPKPLDLTPFNEGSNGGDGGVCVPLTCDGLCGTHADGCGGTIYCGPCPCPGTECWCEMEQVCSSGGVCPSGFMCPEE